MINEDLEEFFEYEDDGTDTVLEYDITTSPRDLTPANIADMIDSGIIEIPFFQRSYVWDIAKASKLIESIILGLPVPELFFYSEGDENSTYKVIDGQQRLLSIYFFLNGRFPKKVAARVNIGKQINEGAELSKLMADNSLFEDFLLKLNKDTDSVISRYNGKKFVLLEKDVQLKFRLRRYLRTVVIRQNKPHDDSSMFEIFNRLNTGGQALTHQEVRASLYYCPFYKMIAELNENALWREIINKPINDLHGSDIELILRSIALLIDGDNYAPKMAMFLNKFSSKSMKFSSDEITYLRQLFISFLFACKNLKPKAFFRNNRFSKALFESVFTATCLEKFNNKIYLDKTIDSESFEQLKNDADFINSLQSGAVSRDGIDIRRKRAADLIRFAN